MNIQEVISKDLCIGCGICTFDPQIKTMEYSPLKGMHVPLLNKNTTYELANLVCPAKGYSIIEDSKKLYGKNNYSTELGFVDKLFTGHSTSKEVLKKASSGGVMTEILMYLLNNKIVDKVAVTKFVYTENGPKSLTFLTNNINDILESQGSKYCPVDISEFIKELNQIDYKIAYLGTPCQIAGIRQIQKINTNIEKNLILTIANFCGGFKSFNQIKKISFRHKISFNNISFLRFRGGGQPGSMLIRDTFGNELKASYRKYGGFTGYSKLLRCHLCVDATGELADIACGDAWLDKYSNDEKAWSVILTRNELATSIIYNMSAMQLININDVSEEDVCYSQRQNLNSKKNRQLTRYKLYKSLGHLIPQFDGGYHSIPTPIKTEIKVFIIHKIKAMLEQFGLYPIFRKIIGKPY